MQAARLLRSQGASLGSAVLCRPASAVGSSRSVALGASRGSSVKAAISAGARAAAAGAGPFRCRHHCAAARRRAACGRPIWWPPPLPAVPGRAGSASHTAGPLAGPAGGRRLPCMGPEVKVMAVTAAVLGLTLTWFHRQRRHHGHHARSSHGTRVVPRGRPLVSDPDQISLISYNILCERCGAAAGAGQGHGRLRGCCTAAAGGTGHPAALPAMPPCRPCTMLQVRQPAAPAPRVRTIPRSRLPLAAPAGGAGGVWRRRGGAAGGDGRQVRGSRALQGPAGALRARR